MVDEGFVLEQIAKFALNPATSRSDANKRYIKNEIVRSHNFFDTIESNPLTETQRHAVVVDEDNNLVVAAAGSGKTSVIVAKVGHLIHRQFQQPKNILVLAYGKDAQSELQERIKKSLGKLIADQVTIKTFHALGLAVIGDVKGRRPSIAKVAEGARSLSKLIDDIIQQLLSNERFATPMRNWFQSYFAPYQSPFDFQNLGEHRDYIRRHQIDTLKGDTVKSFEECEIANFLFLNGIDYKYENYYVHDTANKKYAQYRPDFFLTAHGVYIEHFAVSRDGRTPAFIEQDYLEKMNWKRELHKNYNTPLVETYSYEKREGTLLTNLEAKLSSRGIKLQPIEPAAMYPVLTNSGRIDPFTRLTATFLGHWKSNRLSVEQARQRAQQLRDPARALAYLEVFSMIFAEYQLRLGSNGEIDFNDMIIEATDHVEASRYQNPYSYICVDEFQDISRSRARLLKALLQQSPSNQLFAVGDDWQAIYRFAGSDISVMQQFQKHFGISETTILGETFRCVDGGGVSSRARPSKPDPRLKPG